MGYRVQGQAIMQINIVEDSPQASQELQNKRQNICNTCTNYQLEKDECSLCDCIISRKKFYQDSTCPAGKW